jgi:hypothetical protein
MYYGMLIESPHVPSPSVKYEVPLAFCVKLYCEIYVCNQPECES